MMGKMVGSFAILSAVLSLLPPPSFGAVAQKGTLPWLAATVMSAQLQAERGLLPQAVLGANQGQKVALAVVALNVGGQVRAEVQTAQAFFKMAAAARQAGVDLQVCSGFRTQAEQAKLFRLYQRGRGPLASRPGTSNHQSGHALDIETRRPKVWPWLRRNAERFGFIRTVPGERWHWEHW